VNYTWLTLSQARTQLAALLQDSGGVHFANASASDEVAEYIREALRTFGALTGFWRDRATFSTAAATPFYDLPTVLSGLRGYNVTDLDLFNSICRSLLEPAGYPYTGTPQFDSATIVNALERRRNQFLFDTGCRVERTTVSVSASATGRIDLTDSVIQVRRVAWKTLANVTSVVWKTDEAEAASYYALYTNQGSPPEVWSVAMSGPNTIQLIPPPAANGTLDYLSINAGATLNPATPVKMGIPDDFCWAVRFGALADLLSEDGPAHDPKRAEYCEQRYQDGVTVCRKAQSVRQLQFSTDILFTDSLQELDAARPDWQNDTPAQPDAAAMAGLNLLAFSPMADTTYTVTADVVRNAPVPTADGDYIQLGREEWSAVLGYAMHLAKFKEAGAELEASMDAYREFMELCATYDDTLRALIPEKVPIESKAMREAEVRPARQQPPVPAGAR